MESDKAEHDMRCERCHGVGRVLVKAFAEMATPVTYGAALHLSAAGGGIEVLCPECNGSGIAHCCEGLCAQTYPGVATDVADIPTQ
jgi:DNA-directed RNA polymerase subunit RPC12/RpoP